MIYLDNAATGFPKPEAVIKEVARCMREYCGNPGRGAHTMSRLASDKVFETRELLSEMFGTTPDRVVFTLNTTYALNTVIHGLAKQGCHVLISDTEHNSVLRPVHTLYDRGIITYSKFPTVGLTDSQITEGINNLIRKNTALLICRHSSNVCGRPLPIKEIGKLCKRKNIYFVVDAAQSAGKYQMDITGKYADAICVPSHKGLCGPQGAGMVIFSPLAKCDFSTLVQGGSGTNSKDFLMPIELPDRFEAGTLQTPVIAGLCEGLKFVKRNTEKAIRVHERELSRYVSDRLMNDSRFTVYAPADASGIVTFNIKGKQSTEVASFLDREGICTRAGFHCAPLVHYAYKTGSSGAVRVSFGVFNDKSEASRLLDTLLLAVRQ